MNSSPRLKIEYATLPMSSTAIPGRFASPIGIVRASFPSSPRAGPAPKKMKFSQ